MNSVAVSIKQRFFDCLFEEVHNLSLWLIVSYILGIIVYFYLPFEPNFFWAILTLLASLIVVWRVKTIRYLFIALSFFLSGIVLSSARTQVVIVPALTKPIYNNFIVGLVREVTPSTKGRQIIIDHVSLDENGV